MADEQESSVLFSLKELMNIEEDRIKTEEQDRVEQARQAEQERLEAEQRARQAEEARIREEQQRRAEEERRGREEAARLEAIQRAELEKARAEAEHRARLEAMTQQQSHERQLVALKEDKHKKNLRNLLFGGVAAVLIGGGTAAYFIVKASNEGEQQRLALEKDRAALQQQLDELNTKIQRNQEERDRLEAEIKANAGNPAKIAELEQALKAKENEGQDLANQRKTVGSKGTTGGPTPPPATKKCKPGDPLCSDI